MIETVYKDDSGNIVHIGKLDNPDTEWTECQDEVVVLSDGGRFVASNYKALRKSLYPPIVDQLDDIYHNGLESWALKIKAIKESNPKTG